MSSGRQEIVSMPDKADCPNRLDICHTANMTVTHEHKDTQCMAVKQISSEDSDLARFMC